MKTETACGEGALSHEYLAQVAEILKLLAHPHRLKIIEILERSEGMPVFEIAQALELPPAATSQHLNQMKRMGLVRAERSGKEVRYFVSDMRTVSILGCIRKRRA